MYEVYVLPDTRIRAVTYAKQEIPGNATILSEVYDLGIVPFNPHYSDVTLFNFYEMESMTPESNPEQLRSLLSRTEYVILPSQRLFKTRTTDFDRFPQSGEFYTQLMQENGFTKIYETPCTLPCRLVYLGDPIFSYEGTATVFDRPTVMMYKKNE